MPGQQPGSAQQGMTMVKTGLEALQSALPRLDMGSPMHAAVLKAVTDISKQMSKGPDDASDINQQLAQMVRQNVQGGGQQQAMLARMMPQGGQQQPPAAAA
jgi:hypothetical protein